VVAALLSLAAPSSLVLPLFSKLFVVVLLLDVDCVESGRERRTVLMIEHCFPQSLCRLQHAARSTGLCRSWWLLWVFSACAAEKLT